MSSIVPNMYQCYVCSKVYKYRQSYLEHVESHAQPQRAQMMNSNKMMHSNQMQWQQSQYGIYPPTSYIQNPFVQHLMVWSNQQMGAYYQPTVPMQFYPTLPYQSAAYYPYNQYGQYPVPMMSYHQNQVQNPEEYSPSMYRILRIIQHQ